MYTLKQFGKKVFVIYNYFCFAIVFIVCFPLIYWFSRKPSRFLRLNKIRKIWAYVGCALSGIFIDQEYEEGISRKYLKSNADSFIYCSNHASYLDILVMSQVAQGRFFYLGKQSLLKNPILRIFFKTIDIAFDRESKTDSYRAFKLAGDYLEDHRSLIIFPEGSITQNPPNLRPFKSGAFKLAIEKGVTIIPVSILNSWDIFYAEGQQGAKPGIIKCFVHKPIQTIDYTPNQENELKERVSGLIKNKINDFILSEENSKPSENSWSAAVSRFANHT